jgi:hypothetical protein
MTPRVFALAKGEKKEPYRARIESVTRATQPDSGTLVVCVETLSTLDSREQVHVAVPLDKLVALRERTSLEFGRDGGFDSAAVKETAALRYVFFSEQLEPGCPEAEKELPIHPASTDGTSEAGLYTMPTDQGMMIRYRSPEPLWMSVRDVDLAPVLSGQAVMPGNPRPIYYAVLPFAMLFDGLFAFVLLTQ